MGNIYGLVKKESEQQNFENKIYMYEYLCKKLSDKLTLEQKHQLQEALISDTTLLWSLKNNYLKDYVDLILAINDDTTNVYEILNFIGSINNDLDNKTKQKLINKIGLLTDKYYKYINIIESNQFIFGVDDRYYFKSIPITSESLFSYYKNFKYQYLNSKFRNLNENLNTLILATFLDLDVVAGFIYFNEVRYIKLLAECSGYYFDSKINAIILKKTYDALFDFEPVSSLNSKEVREVYEKYEDANQLEIKAFKKIRGYDER